MKTKATKTPRMTMSDQPSSSLVLSILRGRTREDKPCRRRTFKGRAQRASFYANTPVTIPERIAPKPRVAEHPSIYRPSLFLQQRSDGPRKNLREDFELQPPRVPFRNQPWLLDIAMSSG